MQSTACRANPLSYSQACDTFRAADRTAIGTGLGSPRLVSLNVLSPMPHGFVSEESTEHRPACIVDRLGHWASSEGGRIHVADDYSSIFGSDRVRCAVEKVFSDVGYLGVYRPRSGFPSSALSKRQFLLIPLSYSLAINFGAVAERGQGL